jgi:CRISPR/Cas system Type II protein with McrA/HNH and RuvC-like nuclease domain
MRKFETARSLLSNKLPNASYEDVLETVLDEFLERRNPERKEKQRGKRKSAGRKERRRGKPVLKNDNTRHVPAAIRAELFARDNGRCSYKGPNGKRCDSTRNLQIDHIVPFGRGGTHTIENLRLLCAAHNRLEAERVYGARAIRRFHTRE